MNKSGQVHNMVERSIGLYAKRYMTSEEYEFVGIVLTTSMLERTINGRRPETLRYQKAEAKDTRATKANVQ